MNIRIKYISVLVPSVSDSSSLWSFNNNTLDSISAYNGVNMNSATYYTPGIDGYGSALSLTRSSSQYVRVSTYRDLINKSFTVEMWFYATSLTTGDSALFGQFYAQATDQTLHYVIRINKLHLGFYGDDLTDTNVIQTNTWYHVAFVYDYPSLTQMIYLNGRLDGSHSSSGPYKGISGDITIGRTDSKLTPEYFDG